MNFHTNVELNYWGTNQKKTNFMIPYDEDLKFFLSLNTKLNFAGFFTFMLYLPLKEGRSLPGHPT